jgi:hypothetical protein
MLEVPFANFDLLVKIVCLNLDKHYKMILHSVTFSTYDHIIKNRVIGRYLPFIQRLLCGYKGLNVKRKRKGSFLNTWTCITH